MRHVIRSTLGFVLVVCALACGGGGGGGATEASGSAPTETGASGGEEQATTGGTAGSGDQCDFGGAERYTCQGGLVCCYPEEGEVAYGTCAATCPGYD
jgi:hypothetical protein